MKRLFSIILGIALSFIYIGMGNNATAASLENAENSQQSIYDISLQDNLSTPVVPSKRHKVIAEYMRGLGTNFIKKGYKVETMRDGEVLIISIPSDKIFLANESAMLPTANDLLDPLLDFFKSPTYYKTIIAVHSDNTGSTEYQYKLTEDRVYALYDWFDGKVSDTSSIVGYPEGGSSPLKENTTRANRQQNRRIELYIVPEKGLIDRAKKGKI